MFEMIKSKKGMVGGLTGTIMGVASLALLVVILFLIFAQVKATPVVAGDVNATAAVNTTINAFSLVPSWFTILIVVALGFGVLAYFTLRK